MRSRTFDNYHKHSEIYVTIKSQTQKRICSASVLHLSYRVVEFLALLAMCEFFQTPLDRMYALLFFQAPAYTMLYALLFFQTPTDRMSYALLFRLLQTRCCMPYFSFRLIQTGCCTEFSVLWCCLLCHLEALSGHPTFYC